jgi:hypothetical protein
VEISLSNTLSLLCGLRIGSGKIEGEEEREMTKRRAIPTAPEPLEAYARHFDDLFGKSNQRDEFRHYLEGLLLPTERNKTLTGLAATSPYVGAQHPRAQGMQWFLSEARGPRKASPAAPPPGVVQRAKHSP